MNNNMEIYMTWLDCELYKICDKYCHARMYSEQYKFGNEIKKNNREVTPYNSFVDDHIIPQNEIDMLNNSLPTKGYKIDVYELTYIIKVSHPIEQLFANNKFDEIIELATNLHQIREIGKRKYIIHYQ
jgi:hypothetical protein